MNRFVKNNLVLIIVLGISLVVTIGLLVWTTMQYLQMWQYITQTENLREEIANLIKKTPAPVEGNIPLIETDKKLYERGSGTDSQTVRTPVAAGVGSVYIRIASHER